MDLCFNRTLGVRARCLALLIPSKPGGAELTVHRRIAEQFAHSPLSEVLILSTIVDICGHCDRLYITSSLTPCSESASGPYLQASE